VSSAPTSFAEDRKLIAVASFALSSSGTTSTSTARSPPPSPNNSSRESTRHRLRFRPHGFRRRLRCPPLWRSGLRLPRRPLRPQAHLSRDHALDGSRTVSVGLLPSYSRIGITSAHPSGCASPDAGPRRRWRYGGAAIYVAEQVPPIAAVTTPVGSSHRHARPPALACRGPRCRLWTGPASTSGVGASPFLSVVLLAVSLWMRLSCPSRAAFLKAKTDGQLTRAPLREVFGKKEHFSKVAVAMGGIVIARRWCGTPRSSTPCISSPVLARRFRHRHPAPRLRSAPASPFYVVFGSLSDRIGRKPSC